MPALTKATKIEMLKMRLDKAKVEVAGFAKKLTEDPYEALKWVNSSVEAAATVRVFSATLRNINKGVPENEVIDLAKDFAKRLARTGHMKSTGALDNALAAEELRAWVTVAELLETGDSY